MHGNPKIEEGIPEIPLEKKLSIPFCQKQTNKQTKTPLNLRPLWYWKCNYVPPIEGSSCCSAFAISSHYGKVQLCLCYHFHPYDYLYSYQLALLENLLKEISKTNKNK
ncbi:hypothetical protein GH733_007871, partial [Mirounga leonina]